MIKKVLKKCWKKSHRPIKSLLIVLVILVAGYILYRITSIPPHIPSVQEYKGQGLVRIPAEGWFGGVIAGFAYYFSIRLWILRLVVFALWWFTDEIGDLILIAYILLWIFMPAISFIPTDFAARVFSQ